ncbi:hypothetical protein BHOIPH791_12220 [Bartonella henselae]|nr:hypothetical protein BhenCHDE101_05540 [Bartonella henselae]PNM38699.1 hypothetical protein AL470_004790 [Bartonella henselae str. Houston-1]OLL38548.1 hypothetical protein AT237_02200 [Bartonella henselae]OLL41939.1 hypothetical protein AT244_03945 [Bartonella henselae]OLL45521.1 hypothetical protein AT242_00110 [Bartonella henselae]
MHKGSEKDYQFFNPKVVKKNLFQMIILFGRILRELRIDHREGLLDRVEEKVVSVAFSFL